MLVQYYAKHTRRNGGKRRENKLPSSLKFTIHEVAAAYKRIVRGLPGGLLGSAQLLDTFREIILRVNQDRQLSGSKAIEKKVHLIALALSCVQSDWRFSVICATLGLYSWIGHATEQYDEGDPANMNCKNLSRLLGPLLIGNELNTIRERHVVAGESQPGNETQLSPERIAAGLAAGLANTEDGNQIALTLITHWKGIVRELRCFAVNTAATLQRDIDQKRLANAQSMYQLGRQSPDVLKEVFVGGSKLKIPRSLSQPFKALVSRSKDNVHKPSEFVTRSRNRTQDSAVNFGLPVRMHDGTGGVNLVRSVPASTDGHKTRAATFRTAKRTRPQTEAVVPPVPYRSVYPNVYPGQEEQIEAASAPVVPFAPVHIAAGYGQTGVPYGYEIEPENQRRPGPAYRTRDQRREDYRDDEVPSEDCISNYSASEASGSDNYDVERFEEGTPVSRVRTTNDGSSLRLNSDNTPTPRSRPPIPKPLSDIGRVRRKCEQHHSPPRALKTPPAPMTTPPTPQGCFMSGALGPSDDRIAWSEWTVGDDPRPSYHVRRQPSAREVKRSTAERMTTPASSSQSSALQSDPNIIHDIPTHPMTLDTNNSFTENHAGSDSQPRHSASQDDDNYANPTSDYTDHSANRGSIERQPGSMGSFPGAEDEITEDEEFARRQRASEENDERAIRHLMAEYDEWKIGRQAYHLNRTGRMSEHSVATMTPQDYIEVNKWDVEKQGPPPKMPSRDERRMDEDTDFLIHHRRPFGGFPELEARERIRLQPFIDRVRAAREPKNEAEWAREIEDFKDKIEQCKVWAKGTPARRQAARAERAQWAAQHAEEQAAFELLTDEEKRKWEDRKAENKLERICQAADEKTAAEKKQSIWSRKRQGSGQKSGSSGEAKTKDGDNDARIRGGKVSALKKLFRGGLKKGS